VEEGYIAGTGDSCVLFCVVIFFFWGRMDSRPLPLSSAARLTVGIVPGSQIVVVIGGRRHGVQIKVQCTGINLADVHVHGVGRCGCAAGRDWADVATAAASSAHRSTIAGSTASAAAAHWAADLQTLHRIYW